jgi:electron transfer flavoprotein alpha subunit
MILVVAEHQAGRVNRASVEAIVAAQQLGGPITVVLPGFGVAALARELATADVTSVVALEHAALADYAADAYVAALSAFVTATSPSIIVFAHTYQTRDAAPRLAARLDRPLVTDGIALRRDADRLVVTRPMFQGKVHADVAFDGPGPYCVTVQIGAFRADAVAAASSPVAVQSVPAALDDVALGERPEPPFRETKHAVDLTQAARIVSVGRGIKDQEHIVLAQQLATALGAELAASRPICDAGWLPMDRQIGSSGQTVAPTLYVALGISGAIQHIVGMKGAKTIVAINKDADAPIFEVADFGIVGDLFEVVPAMIAALA